MEIIINWINSLGTFALHSLLPAALLLVVGIIIIRCVMTLVSKTLASSKLEKAAHTLIKTVVRVVLYGLLILIIASRMGIDVTGIIALASVLTLAVSLAVQTALTNVISGFTLIYTNPFSSGDFVEIAGQSGSVLEIGLTYTKLATVDNKEVYIPNSAVTATEIVNYTVRGTRRVDVNVSAAYDAPVEKVLEALREAGTMSSVILPEPAAYVAVTKYGESAIEYVLMVWCNSADYWTALHETNQNVKAVFDAKGIAMTYPHLNVHIQN